MKQLLNSLPLVLLALLSACASADKKTSTEDPNVGLMNSFVSQERTWAGLQSKRIFLSDQQMELTYSVGGIAGRPTLVLLHGFSGDRNNWNRVAQQLQQDYRLIIPDLPGHGESSLHPRDDYSSAEMASILRDFIDQLGIERYFIAGHSMGGGLAVQWSVFRPQQVQGLILINSAGIYEHNGSAVMAQIERGNNPLLVQKAGDLKRVLDVVTYQPPFIPKRLLGEYEAQQIARAATYQKVMDSLMKTQEHLGASMFHRALAAIPSPSLVVWGREDAIFDVGVTEELLEALRDPTLVTFDRVGHMSLLEAPWRTADAIRQFVEKTRAATGENAL
ncbi:lipase [gamma proteobacterium HTCC5015]|nr:lipase [gamma proteobacterium HTCC5015]